MPDDPKLLEAARALAKYETWRRGSLYYLLHATQRKIYDRIAASKSPQHFLCCSRRLGKTFLLTVLAFEAALRKPGARVLYLAPWAKDANDIFAEATARILPDCPQEFKPEYSTQSKTFVFRNGSVIRVRGTNGETADSLRGGSADLVILDEAGKMDSLAYVVDSVVTPMTLTTDGSVILATTPAVTPAHDSKKICDQAFAKGHGHEFTLLDAPHLSTEQKTRALESAHEALEDIPRILTGELMPKGTTALREYFCKWVTDSGSAVVPEFDAKARSECVIGVPRPPYFDAYVAMDPGMVDNTGIIFGYWDIREQRLVIERTWKEPQAGTPEIAKAIRDTEQRLWGDVQPYMRISDIDKRLIADLIRSFGLPFVQAWKPRSHGAVWHMRQMVKSRQIIILPEAGPDLPRQLENATWNTRGTDMERDESEDSIDGHYDLVAALKYLCLMIVKDHNPYPAGYAGPVFGQSGGWRKKDEGLSIRPDTPLSRRLNKAGW